MAPSSLDDQNLTMGTTSCDASDRTFESNSDGEDASPRTQGEPVAALPLRTSYVDRVRHLIALDAVNVARRFDAQLSAMLDLFSRHRNREPLLAPLRSWLPSATFAQLVELEPEEQRAVSRFLEELEALRWYCRYTDDMPNTAQLRLTRFAGQLEGAARHLVETLHQPPQKK